MLRFHFIDASWIRVLYITDKMKCQSNHIEMCSAAWPPFSSQLHKYQFLCVDVEFLLFLSYHKEFIYLNSRSLVFTDQSWRLFKKQNGHSNNHYENTVTNLTTEMHSCLGGLKLLNRKVHNHTDRRIAFNHFYKI